MAEKDSKVYHRDRPVLNIGTIGHVDHGKTTLTAALTKIAAETYGGSSFVPYDRIDKAPEERARGITINTSHVHYNTSKYFCSHTDCPGHADYVKNMIAGAAQMDAAILVVAATDSVMPQTREHIMLARQVGVKHVVVYLNKCDMADSDLVEFSVEEIRDLLSAYGFPGESVHIVEGSALCALEGSDDKLGKGSILALMAAIDEVPLPERAVDGDFIMAIEGVFSIPGRGTVVTGKVEKGRINVGNEVEIVGLLPGQKSICTGVEMYKKQVNDAQAGDNIGILLRGIERNNVVKGQVVAKPGTITPYSICKAHIFISKTEDGGRHTPFASGYRPQFFVRTTDVTGTIFLPKNTDMLMPGDNMEVCIKLLHPIAMSEGLTFAIREGGKTVGAGKVVSVLKDDFDISVDYQTNIKDNK